MPNFAGSKTQQVNKYAGLRAPQAPRARLAAGMHRKTTFCFSANTCWQTVTPGISRQPANAFPVTSGQHLSGLILYRALHFQVITTSLPAPAGNSLSPHIFSYQPHNLTLARNLHSGLTGQHASALILSLFFFYSTPFHTHPHTKKKSAKPISISFSCNPKSSPNLVQAFPSQSLSLLFSPSNQYTLLHRPRSGHT